MLDKPIQVRQFKCEGIIEIFGNRSFFWNLKLFNCIMMVFQYVSYFLKRIFNLQKSSVATFFYFK